MFTTILLLTVSSPCTQPSPKEIEIVLALSLAASKKPIWNSPVDHPEGMFKYARGEHTQSILSSGSSHILNKVRVRDLSKKWVTSGGLEHIGGWVSEKYKYVPRDKEVKSWVGPIEVGVGFGNKQKQLGIKRSYPDGTRFDDVLINKNTGEVFEHRSRKKESGKWVNRVLYTDEKARPKGYTGLSETCISCHRQAGTGEYGQGLVPGGDTIISDPLDFSPWPTTESSIQDTNTWQWTDEEGGYWWKWKEENVSLHRQGSFNQSLDMPFPQGTRFGLDRSVPIEMFAASQAPLAMYNQPSFSQPMFSQPLVNQQVFQQPSFSFGGT